MAAASTSTVRAHAKGMGRRRASLALFAGVAALPLLTMGITVPSAVAKSRAVTERQAMLERLEQRDGLVRSMRAYDQQGILEELEELHETLVGMIPTNVQALDEFGALRASASALEIELVSVRAIRTHDVQGASGEASAAPAHGAIQVDEVLVTLADSVDNVFQLVEELRRRGLPTLLLGFDLTRETPLQRTFQAEVRLGFIRRATQSLPSGPSAH